jgi:hypothetical protein
VNDDRDLGYTGWLAQHSAHIVAPDRLLLYDNGYILEEGAIMGGLARRRVPTRS